MTNNFSVGTSKAGRRPKKSFWITAGIWLLLLILMMVSGVAGAFGAWLVMFALFLIVTALYSLISGRRSWLGLPHRKGAGGAMGAGVAALILGFVATAVASPAPSTIAPLADTKVAVTTVATRSATPTPSPAAKYKLLDECFDSGKVVSENSAVYVCTPDSKGVMVWMSEEASKALLVERAESKRLAEEKVVAEKAAAEKLAAEKAAAEQAAAAQAAADEAARVAAEQAAQQKPPAIQPLVEAPAPAPAAAYYPNCAAARAAGVAPIYQGQPGYRAGLDKDKDGIACDK